MSAPRDHHFVPRFCLAHFVDADGRVWTYDVKADEPRPSLPDQTGYERDFYAVTGSDGKIDTLLEEILSEVESDAAPIYLDMTKGNLPTDGARDIMAHFFSIMFLRSKHIRRTYAETYGQFLQMKTQQLAQNKQIFDSLLNDLESQQGLQISSEKRDQIRNDMADWRNYEVSVSQGASLPIFGNAGEVATVLAQMRWSLLEASDEAYVLSDSPLVRTGPLSDLKTQVTFPLSPKIMWVGHWRDDLPQRSRLSREAIKAFNRMRAAGADRFLYAHRNDDRLMRLCKKYVGPKPGFQIRGANVANLAKVTVRRKR